MAIKEFTVPVRGVGKPDYTREISLGRERPGLSLKHGQYLKVFAHAFTVIPSPYPIVTAPLAIGGTAHLIDAATNLEMPFSIDEGYTLTAISGSYSFTEDAIVWGYMDGFLLAGLGVAIAGTPFYEAQVVGLATTLIDPTADRAHAFDITITNQGLAAMTGSAFFIVLLEAVGTKPFPTTKTVKCKFCGHQWTVPRATSAVNCPNCDELNVYFDLSKFRGTG